VCYILFSPSLNKFYTGITLESVDSRIEKHNLHQYGAHRFTAKYSGFSVFISNVFLIHFGKALL
ncbi:GIY-YIG nuclease family protein, partial [Algoriphagus aestuarii]|nr:GIY-YIG nuclease family protein [Algoriphagus aestuarii]